MNIKAPDSVNMHMPNRTRMSKDARLTPKAHSGGDSNSRSEKDDRSISHDPYSGDKSVLTESPVPDAESASNVHYQETIEGSFLGIDDSMPLKSGAEKKRENPESPEGDSIQFKTLEKSRDPKSNQVDDESGSGINHGKGKAEQSNALDDFLKNLNK